LPLLAWNAMHPRVRKYLNDTGKIEENNNASKAKELDSGDVKTQKQIVNVANWSVEDVNEEKPVSF
jgi:hypothetical protein